MENNRSGKYTAIWVVAAFLLGFSALIYWKMSSTATEAGKQGGAPAKGMGPQKLKATGYVVKMTSIPLLVEAGATLLANQEVQLVPESSGRITYFNLKEGAQVSAGDWLVGIFDEDLKAQLQKQIQQKEIAQQNLIRLKELVKLNGASIQELDNAQNLVNNLIADIKVLEASLKKTKLMAPFSGIVGLTNASMGMYAAAGTPLSSLQQIDVLKLEFSIPEKYFPYLKIGQEVRFTTAAIKDTSIATVYAYEPKVDAATRSLVIRARVQNRDKKLLPGNFAKVWLPLESISNALMIPTQSVIPENKGKKVVRVKNNQAEMVWIKTGIRQASDIQVEEGLGVGDTILTTGLMFARPGSDVQITAIQ